MKNIYVITGMHLGYMYANTKRSRDGMYHSYYKRTSPTQRKIFKAIRERTWGWAPTFREARRILRENPHYILEDMDYTTVVIERYHEGLICRVPQEWWFQWKGSEEKGKFVPCDKPKEFEHVCGWGMG